MRNFTAQTNAERQRRFREKRAVQKNEIAATYNREAKLVLAIQRAVLDGQLPRDVQEGLTNGAVVENLIRYLTAQPETQTGQKTRQRRTPKEVRR